MTAPASPISSRFLPPELARIQYVGGPRDGQADVIEVSGGVPTIFAVDEPLGFYVVVDQLPDGCWRMKWRGFDA